MEVDVGGGGGQLRVVAKIRSLGVAQAVQHQRHLTAEDEVAQAAGRQPPRLRCTHMAVHVQPVAPPLGQYLVAQEHVVPPRDLHPRRKRRSALSSVGGRVGVGDAWLCQAMGAL